MRIQHNIPVLLAHRQSGLRLKQVTKSLERLSTGYRINRAADDPAGLGISERMRGELAGLRKMADSAQNAYSMMQIADGALSGTQDILHRMQELATKAADGSLSDEDCEKLSVEFEELKKGLDHLSLGTNYNGKNLFDGSFSTNQTKELLAASGITEVGAVTFQIDKDGTGAATLKIGDKEFTAVFQKADGGFSIDLGDGRSLTVTLDEKDSGSLSVLALESGALKIGATIPEDADLEEELSLGDVSSKGLGVNDLGIKDAESAQNAIDTLQDAVDKISKQRASLGARMNMMEHSMQSLQDKILSLTEAESKIRDADMAEEMMKYTKSSMLLQVSQTMMAQAMQLPESMMKFLL